MTPPSRDELMQSNAELAVALSDETVEIADSRARLAELEAQVRERDEALKVAAKALDAIANEPLGPMDASDREVLRACEAVALNALAHPLIGGAK